MKKILCSACLLGEPCRYDGKSKPIEKIQLLRDRYEVISICPEVMVGLPTPRLPCEIKGERVIRCDGTDLTCEYTKGAETALELAKKHKINLAILKEKSPSCGAKYIYDGKFRNKTICGSGITTRILSKNGVRVLSEDEIDEII